MANAEHLRILKQGVTAWNEWRKQNAEIQPDLNEAHLAGADLSGAILWKAQLQGANLSGANLSKAKLAGADLEEANFSGANLEGTGL